MAGRTGCGLGAGLSGLLGEGFSVNGGIRGSGFWCPQLVLEVLRGCRDGEGVVGVDVVAEWLADAVGVCGSGGVGEGEEDGDEGAVDVGADFADVKDVAMEQEGALRTAGEFVDFAAIGEGRGGVEDAVVEAIVNLGGDIEAAGLGSVSEGGFERIVGGWLVGVEGSDASVCGKGGRRRLDE
jgi:hypothetical protein